MWRWLKHFNKRCVIKWCSFKVGTARPFGFHWLLQFEHYCLYECYIKSIILFIGSGEIWIVKCNKNYGKWEKGSVSMKSLIFLHVYLIEVNENLFH